MSGINNKYKYLKCLFLLAYFFSMQPWFFYGTFIKSYIYVTLFVILILPIYVSDKNVIFRPFNKKDFSTFVIFSLGLIVYSSTNSLNALISSIPTVLLTLYVIKLKSEVKNDIIDFITKYLSLFILVSLVIHIFILLFSINGDIYYPPDGSYEKGFYQYFIDIIATWMPYKRFQSVFIEPGHLTMGVFPLLLINRFNLKNKYVLILFIAQLFSLSLAGYIYSFIALLVLAIFKKKIKSIILSIIIIASLVGICYNYAVNNPDSAISLAILERLQIEDNNIAGNNRITDLVEQAYENVISSEDIYWGTSQYDRHFLSGTGNNGYKVIIIKQGIFPIIFIILSFLRVGITYNKKLVWFFIFMLLLMISQNFYPYWSSTIISLFAGSNYLAYKKQ